jgi:hypothetical protein
VADAFVLQTLRTARTKASPRGGHAFGATGAILLGCVVDELERGDGRYGVAAVSGAAGLGVAVLVERVAS